MVSWIDPVVCVEHELNQLAEEGVEIQPLRTRWAAVRGQRLSAEAHRASAARFLDELAALSFPSADEPSTLDEIMQASGRPEQKYDIPKPAVLTDRITGGWFGRAAGCLLGKPVEKIPREGIRELLESNGSWPLSTYISEKGIPDSLLAKYPWNRHAGRESLRENILCMTEDDDMNYPMLNLSLLESYGEHFTTEQVVESWLCMLPVLSTFTAERVAYLNCLNGIEPPTTAVHRNPYREWIGAQIRGDVFGWSMPGEPVRAAEMAFKDGRLSHVRNGVYGEMFVAGMIAAACCVNDLRQVIDSGLRLIPPASRLAEAIRFSLSLPAMEPYWEGAVDRLYEKYGHYHWVHTINNAALVVAALIYGEGDFERSVCNVVMGGWDTDSNGATVGWVVGTMRGVEQLPPRWISPLNNRIRSSLKGFDNSAIDRLAQRAAAIALQNS
jgi:ADP-ribosylglycohydrolase